VATVVEVATGRTADGLGDARPAIEGSSPFAPPFVPLPPLAPLLPFEATPGASADGLAVEGVSSAALVARTSAGVSSRLPHAAASAAARSATLGNVEARRTAEESGRSGLEFA
jgi:hypothetical protein